MQHLVQEIPPSKNAKTSPLPGLQHICVQVIAEISRNWMPPTSLKGAFLFGKSVCRKILGYTAFPQILRGNNMQKTPFKNSSWLSHNLKMFEYMSTRKNNQIDKVQQLTKTWSQNFGHHFQTI